MGELQVGELAADFVLGQSGNGFVHLGELRGRRVFGYFYTDDDIPGCIRAACATFKPKNHAEDISSVLKAS